MMEQTTNNEQTNELEIIKLKAQVYDLIAERERLEAIDRGILQKIQELNNQIVQLVKQPRT